MSSSPRPVRRHADLDTVHLDGCAVLFDERRVTLHRLNEFATLVWDLLDGRDLTSLERAVAVRVGTEATLVRADVARTIELLATADLLADEAGGREPPTERAAVGDGDSHFHQGATRPWNHGDIHA